MRFFLSSSHAFVLFAQLRKWVWLKDRSIRHDRTKFLSPFSATYSQMKWTMRSGKEIRVRMFINAAAYDTNLFFMVLFWFDLIWECLIPLMWCLRTQRNLERRWRCRSVISLILVRYQRAIACCRFVFPIHCLMIILKNLMITTTTAVAINSYIGSRISTEKLMSLPHTHTFIKMRHQWNESIWISVNLTGIICCSVSISTVFQLKFSLIGICFNWISW